MWLLSHRGQQEVSGTNNHCDRFENGSKTVVKTRKIFIYLCIYCGKHEMGSVQANRQQGGAFIFVSRVLKIMPLSLRVLSAGLEENSCGRIFSVVSS